MASPQASPKLRVLIAGGGIAALETALALHALAPELTETTLLAPNTELVNRPMTVREPFADPLAHRYPLALIAAEADAQLVAGTLAWVDPAARIVHTASEQELSYDALVLALGGRISPRYKHAITIDDRNLEDTMHGLIQDIEGGFVGSVAFVAPPRMGWPLPIYELALMTAARAFDANVELDVSIVTPEDSPLAIFGQGASTGVGELLDRARISAFTSAYAEIPEQGRIVITPGGHQLEVDRIVALPELFGPEIRGIALSEHGFLGVDQHCRLLDHDDVWAAGDAIDFAVKHGGLGSQQADVVAEAIAARAGAEVTPAPFQPVIRGMLLTGGKPVYLTARITGGAGFSSEISDEPSWWPATKVASRYLSPCLDALEHARTP